MGEGGQINAAFLLLPAQLHWAIGEAHNFADAKPARAKAMHEAPRNWMAGVPAEVPAENLRHETERACVETKEKSAWYLEAMKADCFDTLNGKPTAPPPTRQKR